MADITNYIRGVAGGRVASFVDYEVTNNIEAPVTTTIVPTTTIVSTTV
jgi:hypothetical protein